jgi:hypothetical protein
MLRQLFGFEVNLGAGDDRITVGTLDGAFAAQLHTGNGQPTPSPNGTTTATPDSAPRSRCR